MDDGTINCLHLISSFHQGGSERQAIRLSREINALGKYKILLSCLDRTGPLLAEVDWCDPDLIREFRISSFYDLMFVRQVFACAKFLREQNVGVIHTHDFYSNIFGILSGSIAQVPIRIASKRETFSKTRIQFFVERQVYRLANRIIVNAEAVRKFLLERGIRDEKIVTIYNGTEERDTGPQNHDIARLSVDLASIPNRKFVTMVANLHDEVKNHAMFLRAAKIVCTSDIDVKFLLVGEGNLLKPLSELAGELGVSENVNFLGRCSYVAEVLEISDVCVLSSRSEGFSNAILEYMAAGKPVVATNVGGAAEAIVHGVTGFLVDSDDHFVMAERIIELLMDKEKAEEFGNRGRKRVKERFLPHIQVTATINLYDQLLKGMTQKSSLV